MFELKLRSKLFSIPSDFRFLNDIKDDIYETLTSKKIYEVKSYVSEDVFQSFIQYLVERELPIINKNNKFEFEELSNEFDQMKEVIQLYKNKEVSYLFDENQKLMNQMKKKTEKLKQKNAIYEYIINDLFKERNINWLSNKESSKQFKLELFNSCITENIEFFILLTNQKAIIKDNFIFLLNEQEKTAGLFKYLANNKTIKVPQSINHQGEEFIITSIVENSFKDSTQIESITFSKNSYIYSIGKNAFSCSSLQKIEIPSSVVEICEEAFSYCKELTDFRFQKDSQLLVISKKAFANSSLQVICIPQSVEWIEESSFNSSSLREIQFSSSSNIKYIGEYCFSQSNIQSITIPPKVTQIQSYTFLNCEHLMSVYFPYYSQLKTIKKFAFLNSSIKKLDLPKKMEKLEPGWAAGTPSLIEIIMKNENNAFEQNFGYYEKKYIIGKSDPSIFYFDVLEFANRNIPNAKIPSFIKYISQFAFDGCKNLQKVEFTDKPDLLCIGKYAFSNASISTFSIPSTVIDLRKSFSCMNVLNEILVLPKNPYFTYIEKSILVGKLSKNSVDYDVIIFARKDIKRAVIPSFIKRIESYAFYRCLNLRYIEFSSESQLESIGKDAFAGCPIEKLTIPPHVNKIGKSSFCGCSELSCIKFDECCELTSIKNSTFDLTRIESISLPHNVTVIKKRAFEKCCHLKIIEIPENTQLISIDPSIFNHRNVILMIPYKISQSILSHQFT